MWGMERKTAGPVRPLARAAPLASFPGADSISPLPGEARERRLGRAWSCAGWRKTGFSTSPFPALPKTAHGSAFREESHPNGARLIRPGARMARGRQSRPPPLRCSYPAGPFPPLHGGPDGRRPCERAELFALLRRSDGPGGADFPCRRSARPGGVGREPASGGPLLQSRGIRGPVMVY